MLGSAIPGGAARRVGRGRARTPAHRARPTPQQAEPLLAAPLSGVEPCQPRGRAQAALAGGAHPMPTHTHYLWFETKRRQEIIDITDEVESQVRVSGIREGFALVSAMHISASVFVNDHESGLWHDILNWLEGTIAPWEPARYRHNETGEDNAAAHLRSLTVGHEVIVPITSGRLDLGPWQRVFYGEWDGQRRKRVIIKVLGET